MLYAILCYNSEDRVSWTKEEDDAVMAKLIAVQEKLAGQGKLGPGRAPAADHRRHHAAQGPRADLVIDGPFAETKEQLLGFYIVECDDLDEALDIARELGRRQSRAAPTRSARCRCSSPGSLATMTDLAWIDAALDLRPAPGGRRAAALFPRPRHRRGGVPGRLPAGAEELAAERPAARSRRLADLRRPQRGHRRGAPAGQEQAAAGRGAALRPRATPRPRWPSGSTAPHYRDDVLRLLFICCHPDLPATQQIALALRIVSGLSVQADRPRLPGRRKRDGAAHHPRQGAHRRGRRAVRDAGRRRAGRAARRGRGHDLSGLQRGLFGERRRAAAARAAVRRGDPAGAPAAAAVPDRAGDHGPAGADAAAACARAGAVRRRTARSCCWRTRTAACGTGR